MAKSNQATTPQVHIVLLSYDITFNDADEGRCYAGNGSRIVRVFLDQGEAVAFADKWNPIIRAASEESTIYPKQPNNKKLGSEFGFDLHDVDDGGCFRLEIESHEVVESKGCE